MAAVEQILESAVKKHPYPLVFATISGAHLYGFASPDSDADLRGVHVLPLEDVVGLQLPNETLEETGIVDGLEIDLVTHDVRKFFRLLLKKNGYVLEQLYSPLIVHTTPDHMRLKAIAMDCITRHHSHHYLGFANSQWSLFQNEDVPRIKPLLYVYRVLLTGIHLMRTGQIEANLVTLNQEFALDYIPDLISQKIHGSEKQSLPPGSLDFFRSEFVRLNELLKQESERSNLPDTPSAEPMLDELLKEIRLRTR
jgi:predicted nucleotidyltransferase